MVLRGVSPLYFNIMVVLEEIVSEVVIVVKRLRITGVDDQSTLFKTETGREKD